LLDLLNNVIHPSPLGPDKFEQEDRMKKEKRIMLLDIDDFMYAPIFLFIGKPYHIYIQ